MEMAGALKTIEAAINGQSTALPQLCDTSRMDHLMALSQLTDAECNELRDIALAMPQEHIPVETRELSRQLQFIASTLPSKNTDEHTGQMRTAVYARILGGYPKEALSYMTQRACRELNWFPTPKQCLDILADYRPPATRKDRALKICADHVEARFAAFNDSLRTGDVTQATIDAAPDRWKRIAYERGLLKRDGDGYVARPDPC
jgi:hypothetical protein